MRTVFWVGIPLLFLLAACSTAPVRVTATGQGNIGVTDVAGPWQQQALEVTGSHVSFGETCRDFYVDVMEPPHSYLETATEVTYQNKDTHWEHSNFGTKAHWHYCANNCVFSCDTIRITAKWRVMSPPQKPASADIKQEKWAVYAEHTNTQNSLSCWVCSTSTAGTAACIGNTKIPHTEWDTRDQAGASACVLKKTGKCLHVQNYSCPEVK